MSDEKINDFLLDQELEPDGLAVDGDLPDDIDAILDAVEEEEFKTLEIETQPVDTSYADDTPIFDESILIDPEEDDLTPKDLRKEINLAAEAPAVDNSIPTMHDIVDPETTSGLKGKSGKVKVDGKPPVLKDVVKRGS